MGDLDIRITEGSHNYRLKYAFYGYRGPQFTGEKVTVRQQNGQEVVYDFDVYNKDNPMEVTVGENLFVAFYNAEGQKFMREGDRPIIELYDQWWHDENGLSFWQIEKEFQVMAFSNAATSVENGVHKLVFEILHNDTMESATLYFKAVLPAVEVPEGTQDYTGNIVTREEVYNDEGEVERVEFISVKNNSTIKAFPGREFNFLFGTMKNGVLTNAVRSDKIQVVDVDEAFTWIKRPANAGDYSNILHVRFKEWNHQPCGSEHTLTLLVDGKIKFDYIVEIKGAQAERTSFSIEIEDISNDTSPISEYAN